MNDREQKLSGVLEGLLLSLRILHEAVRDLPRIIADEEKAVIRHDIGALEKILGKKKKCAEVLQEAKARCQKSWVDLQNLSGVSEASGPLNLSEFSALLNELASRFEKNQALHRPLQACIRLLSEIREKFSASEIPVKRNRLIVSKLLYNHQESYRFWNQLIREKNSHYNEKGTVRDLEKVSQISVEA